MRANIENSDERERRDEKEKREDEERWDHYQQAGEAVSNEVVSEWLNALGQGIVNPCPNSSGSK